MNKTIDQFMWAFQDYFRGCVKIKLESVLNDIGMPATDAKVVLVGIATEESARHPICVEPETGPLFSKHLTGVASRAGEMYQSNRRSRMFITDPHAGSQSRNRLFRSSRANAIAEAIEDSGVFTHLTFFVSQSSPINGYEVHTCIGIPKDVIGSLFAFKDCYRRPTTCSPERHCKAAENRSRRKPQRSEKRRHRPVAWVCFLLA